MLSNFLARVAYADRFEVAYGIWSKDCDNVPESWGFIDPEQTIPIDYPLATLRDLLDRAFTEIFWQLPS